MPLIKKDNKMTKYIPLPDWIKWDKEKGKYVIKSSYIDNNYNNYEL